MCNKNFRCIAKCPELNHDGTYCIDTMDNINRKISLCGYYCPVGNQPIWEEMIEKDNQEKWIAFMSETDCEIWSEDLDGSSREDVINDGMKLAKEEGLKSFRIGRAEECTVPTIWASTIIENAGESLHDEVGEVSEDYLKNVTKEQEQELEDKLNEVFYE